MFIDEISVTHSRQEQAMSICVLDPEMPTTPAEKNVLKQPNAGSDELSLVTAPLTPQSPPSESLPSAESSPAADSSQSVESREDQPQRRSSWNRGHNQNRRRYNNNRPKPRKFGPRNTEMRPYHSPNHVSPPHDRPMTKNDIYFALDCEVRLFFRLLCSHITFCINKSLESHFHYSCAFILIPNRWSA